MKFAIVVPARKGSKSVKNKNLIKINKKHLIEYTLIAANKSDVKLKFILTDDKKIKKISKKYNFNTEYIRPKKVSHSKASLVDTLLDFIRNTEEKYRYDYLVVLQPTSPMRDHRDINNAIKLIIKKKATSLASISESQEHPYEQIIINKKKWRLLFNKSKRFYRRQDFDIKVFFITGAIYIISKASILRYKKIITNNHVNFLMKKLKSLDINDYEDIEIAKYLLKK
ncbi:acylneuraminate cytidylyltransferase family protein [Candidatus Pelagibacter sp.]|nr:acylneuraminate cytidylyltransferase family protein [Candidatus Pelagibacter sp.]